MANKILVARGTKARLEEIKSTLATNELVYSTDTGELGVKKANGNIEYFKNAADIDAIVTGKQDKLTAGDNITIDENNVISASGTGGGGEVDLDEMAYFDYAGSIYGDKYSLLASAWEHSLTVDPSEISVNSTWQTQKGTAQYPNGETEGVIIPQGVISIGKWAFYNWTSNNQPLVIPNSVTSIGEYAFRNWSANNQPLVIPDSVTSIGNSAFYGWNTNNQPLVIPNSATEIGDFAFSFWDSNNQPLVIPNSVTSIGEQAFYRWVSNNQPLVIPNSVASIGASAFTQWLANEHPLVIPNSVTSIGDSVFSGWISNTQPLVIPSSVTSIGQYAFSDWTSAKEFIMESETPPTIAGNSFVNTNDAPFYVPDESVEAYKTAPNWSNYANRIFPISNRTGGSSGGGGVTRETLTIPFTEVVSQTQTEIMVLYNYVGDDPVNFTADFSNFTLGGGLSLNMGDGPIPINMAVQAVFGKTTLNYFEIIILFRYIISATLMGAINDGSGRRDLVLSQYDEDYRKFLPNVFEGISAINADNFDELITTFTVDFMMVCQDMPFYNTVTGRGSNLGVTVESVGDIGDTPLLYTGVQDGYISTAWEYLKATNDLDAYTLYYIRYIGGMTLRLFPAIKMKVNYNGGMFTD